MMIEFSRRWLKDKFCVFEKEGKKEESNSKYVWGGVGRMKL